MQFQKNQFLSFRSWYFGFHGQFLLYFARSGSNLPWSGRLQGAWAILWRARMSFQWSRSVLEMFFTYYNILGMHNNNFFKKSILGFLDIIFFVFCMVCWSPPNGSLMAACGFFAKGSKIWRAPRLNGIISPSSDGVRQSFYMENVGMVVSFHFHPTRAQTDASVRRNRQPDRFSQKCPNRPGISHWTLWTSS